MNIKPFTKLCALLFTVGFVLPATAGSLEPSGPPAPTFKTLTDVEPRQAIRANTEVIEAITISQPGSYYLAENVTAIPENNGITITADDVTLDLNGFTVRGNLEVNDGHGILVSGDNITISNGSVRFADGDGIRCENASYLRLLNVNSLNNTGSGVLCSQMQIVNGEFSKNGGSGVVGSNIVADGVAASENTFHGFSLGSPSNVSRSLALGNGAVGLSCTALPNFGVLVTQTIATSNTTQNLRNCVSFDSYTP